MDAPDPADAACCESTCCYCGADTAKKRLCADCEALHLLYTGS